MIKIGMLKLNVLINIMIEN